MLANLGLTAAILLVLLAAAHGWLSVLVERRATDRMAGVGGAGPRARSHRTDTIPGLVRRYAARAGVSQDALPRAVVLHQKGQLRTSPRKKWAPMAARQKIAIGRPEYVWVGERRWGSLVLFRVVDAFFDGAGALKVHLMGSFPLTDHAGPDADRDQLMRYLAELPWAPDALLANPHLSWRPVGDNVVKVTANSAGGPASVRFFFDADGDIREVRANARGSLEKGKLVMRPWIGHFSDYREIGGRRIPARAEVGYVYDDGYAAYWRGEIVRYQVVGD